MLSPTIARATGVVYSAGVVSKSSTENKKCACHTILSYYPLLGGCHVFSSTINHLPTQEGEKVRISTVVRVG